MSATFYGHVDSIHTALYTHYKIDVNSKTKAAAVGDEMQLGARPTYVYPTKEQTAWDRPDSVMGPYFKNTIPFSAKSLPTDNTLCRFLPRTGWLLYKMY